MSALHDLAAAAGLQRDWTDALGHRQQVADDALAAVLEALGHPADGNAAVTDSLAALHAPRDPAFLSADAGTPVALPEGWARAELLLESGARQEVTGAFSVDEIGYHRLVSGERSLRLAVAPPRCFSVADAMGNGRRVWAPALQVYAMRGPRPSAFGDLGAMADAVVAFGKAGAQAAAISPTHALFPADPARYSPYAPSSRLFHNVLFGDPSLIGAPVDEPAGGDLIEWSAAMPARLAHLRRAWAGAREPVRDAVASFRHKGGGELERHARFDALHAYFFALTGASGWAGWPSDYHDPDGEAVARFAAQHADEVSFYAFLQWLAKSSLDAAQAAARGAGMAIGLVADLAVGMDGGGSHAWSRPDDLLTGLSIGAPPDLLGPDGQNWGITGFAPAALERTGFDAFIATLRASLDHAGGIRIDHALGLRRLWVVPDGASAADGAYLTMPLDDFLRIIAIESVKARAIVIGEDLGTVPEGLRDRLVARDILGMRVLPFERADDGGFIAPRFYAREAAAMTGTHDLPTIAGWWQGRDIDWNWDLGRTTRAESRADDLAARDVEKRRFWDAAVSAGVGEGPLPTDPAPAVDAAVAFIGETPSVLAIVPVEDIAGLVEQPNLPGTIDEHPNWRRRLPATTGALLAEPAAAHRIDLLNEARDR